jgi:ABC-2 type transport system ATP-binding protein
MDWFLGQGAKDMRTVERQSVIEARGLSKRFGATVALQSLDLDVAAGEVVCLLGANGAGKSTTLNLLLGFLRPDSGEARVAGALPGTREARRAIGYVPEAVALYPKLSGLENLAFFHRLNDAGKPREADLLAALARVGLDEGAARRRAETYSKGMRQKVGLAAALLKDARALLLDEPLSGLDPDAANGFQELVRDAARSGAAVLMATHDIFRAKEVATRVGIMRGGRLIELLPAADVGHSDLEALYLKHMRQAA